jgi:hypothetical protein
VGRRADGEVDQAGSRIAGLDGVNAAQPGTAE